MEPANNSLLVTLTVGQLLELTLANPGNFSACSGACPRFDSCSANICPMDEQSMKFGSWYPSEEYCQLKEFSKEAWVVSQRKISKKVRNKDFYFTHEMLCQNCVITVATEGIDPDHDYSDKGGDVAKWLADHPLKRVLSDEERTNRRVLMLAARQGLDPLKKGANRIEKQDKNE